MRNGSEVHSWLWACCSTSRQVPPHTPPCRLLTVPALPFHLTQTCLVSLYSPEFFPVLTMSGAGYKQENKKPCSKAVFKKGSCSYEGYWGSNDRQTTRQAAFHDKNVWGFTYLSSTDVSISPPSNIKMTQVVSRTGINYRRLHRPF